MRFLAAFSMVCAAIANSVSVKDCAPGSPFRITTVDFSPADPVPGQNGTLHTVYDVPVQVEGGTARYSCTLNGLPVYDETFDLCSQTACPITAGTHDDHSISAVPATSGKVSCKINWSNDAGAQLMCIQMSLTLNAAKSLRGAPAVFVPPTLFHSHIFGAPVSGEMCNITEYNPFSAAQYELLPLTEEEGSSSSSSGGSGSSSSSGMGNNTSTSSGGSTSTGGSTSASETRMKALVVRLRGPQRQAA